MGATTSLLIRKRASEICAAPIAEPSAMRICICAASACNACCLTSSSAVLAARTNAAALLAGSRAERAFWAFCTSCPVLEVVAYLANGLAAPQYSEIVLVVS